VSAPNIATLLGAEREAILPGLAKKHRSFRTDKATADVQPSRCPCVGPFQIAPGESHAGPRSLRPLPQSSGPSGSSAPPTLAVDRCLPTVLPSREGQLIRRQSTGRSIAVRSLADVQLRARWAAGVCAREVRVWHRRDGAAERRWQGSTRVRSSGLIWRLICPTASVIESGSAS
jgi:hypothetical protein